MKKIIFTIVIGLLFTSSVAVAADSDSGWEIKNFHSKITINKDSSLSVEETINVEFFTQKHGIYRNIPVNYKDKYDNNLNLIFDLLSVKDGKGEDLQYELSHEEEYAKIKIGDPNTTFDGKFTYVISYKLERVLNYFDNHDELYFNITGSEWEVPIPKTTATVYLPDGSQDLKAECFVGGYGSQEKGTYKISSKKIDYEGDGFLTIVAGWSKGVVEEPSFGKKFGWFMQDNWFLFIPFIILVFCFYLWWRRGRDPRGRGTIITQFDPPDKIPPAIMGVLIDQFAGSKDVSSTFVDLAVRGYLKIKEIEKKGVFGKTDYELIRLKEYNGDNYLKSYEFKLLKAVFGGANSKKLSDLKDNFANDLSEIKRELYKESVDCGYFLRKPSTTRGIYIGIACAFELIWFLLILIPAIYWNFGVAYILSGILSGIFLFAFAFIMPRRTQKGILAYEYALGFKDYLETAEKYRLKFAESENIFEKYLPYAMVFGVADKWSKAFADIYKDQPSWYEGSTPTSHFSTVAFANSLNDFSTTTGSTMSSTASSGGSGFSSGGGGGGFGGGGGGSW